MRRGRRSRRQGDVMVILMVVIVGLLGLLTAISAQGAGGSSGGGTSGGAPGGATAGDRDGTRDALADAREKVDAARTAYDDAELARGRLESAGASGATSAAPDQEILAYERSKEAFRRALGEADAAVEAAARALEERQDRVDRLQREATAASELPEDVTEEVRGGLGEVDELRRELAELRGFLEGDFPPASQLLPAGGGDPEAEQPLPALGGSVTLLVAAVEIVEDGPDAGKARIVDDTNPAFVWVDYDPETAAETMEEAASDARARVRAANPRTEYPDRRVEVYDLGPRDTAPAVREGMLVEELGVDALGPGV